MNVRSLSSLAILLCLVGCGPASVGGGQAADANAVSTGASAGGLLGQYFSGTDFSSLVLTRMDATVDFYWKSDRPAPGVPADGFSVRWAGYVTPRYSETYTFSTWADDGTRLWVNGQLLVDDWNHHAVTWHGGTVTLSANHAYSIKLEYFEKTGLATAQLNWQSASEPYAVIPASRLSPTAVTPPTAPPSTSATFLVGLQSGSVGVKGMADYEVWLGHPVEVAASYNGNGSWGDVENPQWILADYGWKPWVAADPQHRMVQLGVEPWAGSGSLAACARGDYDVHYRNMGTNFVKAGMARTAFRFAWEEAGDWFPWGTGKTDANGGIYQDAALVSAHKGCFQHFSTAIHSTDPSAIVTWDADEPAFNAQAYPGDAYVDQVSHDVYDESFQWDNALGGFLYPFPGGCDSTCETDRRERAWTEDLGRVTIADANFATAHHKPFSLGEWGVAWKLNGHGGLDNPGFIQHIHNVMTGTEPGMTPGFQGGFATYWDNAGDLNSAGQPTIDTRLRGGRFPNAAARYRSLFGSRSPTDSR